MQALSQTQGIGSFNTSVSTGSSHSHRRRTHRGEPGKVSKPTFRVWNLHYERLVQPSSGLTGFQIFNIHGELLGGEQNAWLPLVLPPVSNKLQELKAQKFTLPGREERIARSLAALNEPTLIPMTRADWLWLDENSDVEDQFE